MRAQAAELAARVLEADPEDIEFEDGRVGVVGSPGAGPADRPARRDRQPAAVRVRRGVGRGGALHAPHLRVAGGAAARRDDARA